MNIAKIDLIITLVSEHFGQPKEKIISKDMSRKCTTPRHVCWHLISLQNVKQTDIAAHFKTTPGRVGYGRKKVRDFISINDRLKVHVNIILQKIKAHETEPDE